VCVFDQAHSTLKWGWADTDRGKDRLQKGFTVNSNTKSSVGYMKNKQNEVSQDGSKGEQNNTAQRLYRKHKKHTEDNKAHRKHRHSEGDGYTLKRGK